MTDLLSTSRGKVSPGRLVVCILVVGVFLALTWNYARTLHIGGGTMIRQPLQTARRIFAASMQFCDDDPAGRRVLEAEAARAEGPWKETKRVSAAGARERSTMSIGARLTWDLSLAAGDYQLLLLAGPCSQISEVKVAFDGWSENNLV